MSWKKTQSIAAKEIGFGSITELARLSKVNVGTLSSITRGKRKPSPENAAALIEAIIAKNPDKGLSYIEAATLLCAALNFLRNHASHIFQTNMPPEINDEDVLSWYPLSPQVAVTHHQEYEETLRLIRLADTAEILQYILNLAREWEMKHDFELWGKKEEAFRNKRAIISSGIRRATLEEGHYGLVRDVYTEIRHTAHLCKEYQLIIDTSRWLIEHAYSISDLQTLVKAKVTLAWTFTSARDQHPKMLYEAFGILGELKSIIECSEFLEEISENDMDVIAIFCELQLRLRIRLWRQRGHSLSEEECLRTLMSSKELLGRSSKFRNLDPRLQQRFSIPLHYQRGIWFFYIQDFRESIKVFEEISERASLIAWERVQQGAFSWLASNFQEIQDEYNLRIYLDKINKSYFPKRLLIRERLSNGNSSAE